MTSAGTVCTCVGRNRGSRTRTCPHLYTQRPGLLVVACIIAIAAVLLAAQASGSIEGFGVLTSSSVAPIISVLLINLIRKPIQKVGHSCSGCVRTHKAGHAALHALTCVRTPTCAHTQAALKMTRSTRGVIDKSFSGLRGNMLKHLSHHDRGSGGDFSSYNSSMDLTRPQVRMHTHGTHAWHPCACVAEQPCHLVRTHTVTMGRHPAFRLSRPLA